jgi:uncharacterized protein (TIGR00369 family)
LAAPVASLAPVVFEADYIRGLTELFEEKIVFNQLLGLKLLSVQPDRASASLSMRRDLVGHFGYNRVHGGVISAALDTLGGLAVLAAQGARHMDEAPALRLQRFAKLGTIDLRIDYLRPGISEHFVMHAEVLRVGSRVANTRMAFHGADGKLLAVGAGVYIIS